MLLDDRSLRGAAIVRATLIKEGNDMSLDLSARCEYHPDRPARWVVGRRRHETYLCEECHQESVADDVYWSQGTYR